METEYLYPPIGNRMTPMEWKEVNSPDIWQTARQRVMEMMQHYPSYITPEQDAEIRGKFRLQISADQMSPSSRRWSS